MEGYDFVVWFWNFVVYSFLGFLLEVTFARMTGGRPDRKCLLVLPLCPVYGLGSCSILLLPSWVASVPLLLFLGGALAATAAEYLMAFFYEEALGVSFWDYRELPADEAGLRRVAEELSLGGKRSVALTGASLAPGKTGAMCFDARTGRTEAVQTDFIAHPLHGTGDVFASVLTGALVKGVSLVEAAGQAVDFIHACAVRTVEQDLPLREGVDFEPLLGLLTDKEVP